MAGIYIHIPFCRKACTYCNFHFSTSLKLKDDYLQALIKEILSAENALIEDNHIETIYFGGGTPSLLTAPELSLILEAINSKFSVDPAAEVTLEANPDDINFQHAKNWLGIGINRLSVGLQSFNEDELKWMNRAHSSLDSLQSLDDVLSAGFSNFSADLIYGSPLQSNDDLRTNALILFEKRVPHISCYALTVEPKTALDKMILNHQSDPVDPEKQAEQFEILLNLMDQYGYEQYETSNFALPGYRSKHNSSYWQGKAYYGFGASAHSYDGIFTRRWNVANNALYIQFINSGQPAFEEERLTITQQLNEYIMTSLRTIEGLSLEKVRKEFGEAEFKRLKKSSTKYISQLLMTGDNEVLNLTRKGKFLADGISSDLFAST